MSIEKECMACRGPWPWSSENIFDFSKPMGKRIWPAVCTRCRTDLQHKYRSGEITYNELLMEFSTISGRISLKCAVSDHEAAQKLKDFTPKKRGKHG